MIWGTLLPMAGSALGGLFENRSNAASIGAAADLAAQAGTVNPFGFTGGMGALSFDGTQGGFALNPQQQAIQQAMQGQILAGLSGPNQQQFLQQFDPAGQAAFTDQQAFLAQGFQPQEVDTSALVQQRLDALRGAAKEGEQRQTIQLADRLFGAGQLGSGNLPSTTGGAATVSDFALGLQRADDLRQIDALDFGTREAQRLFGNQAQTFGINQTAGQNRLANMMQQFGLGSSAIAQDQATSQGLFGSQLSQEQMMNQLFLGSLGADASRMGAQASVLDAQAKLLAPQAQQAASTGGLIAGVGKTLGGLFSDKRLKENVELYRTINGINFYQFTWKPGSERYGENMTGADMGVIAQELQIDYPELVITDDRSGYLKVDYDGVLEIING